MSLDTTAIFVDLPDDNGKSMSFRVDAIVGFVALSDYECSILSSFPYPVTVHCSRENAVARVERAVDKARNPGDYPPLFGEELGYGLLHRLSEIAFKRLYHDATPEAVIHCAKHWYHDLQPKHGPPDYVGLAFDFIASIGDLEASRKELLRNVLASWESEFSTELKRLDLRGAAEKHPDFAYLDLDTETAQ